MRRPPRPTPFPYTTLFRSTGDSGVAPSGAVTVLLGPSLLAGVGLDSGALRLRLADRRLYVDSLRLAQRSEEHTSELQSPDHLVCRLLLEKKKQQQQRHIPP